MAEKAAMMEYCHHWTHMRAEDGSLWLACTDPGCRASYNWTLERQKYDRSFIDRPYVIKRPLEVDHDPPDGVYPYSDDFGGGTGLQT